jgi:hypothetical protein
LIYVDSEEKNYPGYATMSFDGDPETIWHTRWSTGDDPYPHEIQIDLGRVFTLYKFTYQTRQDGENGRIKAYELYISNDTLDWGPPVKTGEFANTASPQTIEFDTAETGQYFRLLALSEVNGNPWASAAEFSMVGCTDPPVGTDPSDKTQILPAFPVPTGGIVNVTLPFRDRFSYRIISVSGSEISYGEIENTDKMHSFNLRNSPDGIYFIVLTDDQGIIYRVKVIKNH